MLRRLETQADCFSGQFMRSVSQSLGIQQSDLPASRPPGRPSGTTP